MTSCGKHHTTRAGLAMCDRPNQVQLLVTPMAGPTHGNGGSRGMQGTGKTPMQYVEEIEPIECHGLTVASRGCELRAPSCMLK